MKRVFKYVLSVTGVQWIEMPYAAVSNGALTIGAGVSVVAGLDLPSWFVGYVFVMYGLSRLAWAAEAGESLQERHP